MSSVADDGRVPSHGPAYSVTLLLHTSQRRASAMTRRSDG